MCSSLGKWYVQTKRRSLTITKRKPYCCKVLLAIENLNIELDNLTYYWNYLHLIKYKETVPQVGDDTFFFG